MFPAFFNSEITRSIFKEHSGLDYDNYRLYLSMMYTPGSIVDLNCYLFTLRKDTVYENLWNLDVYNQNLQLYIYPQYLWVYLLNNHKLRTYIDDKIHFCVVGYFLIVATVVVDLLQQHKISSNNSNNRNTNNNNNWLLKRGGSRDSLHGKQNTYF